MTLTAPDRDALPEQRRRRITPPLLVAGGVLLASVALHVRDPHESGSWGVCPWLLLTGSYCPGCGGLRAVNDLTRGDLGAAASSNLAFVGSIPVLALLWLRWFTSRWTGERRSVARPVVVAGVTLTAVVVTVFTVARNLPGSWLAP